jgi:ABC-2 type transport system permease protein
MLYLLKLEWLKQKDYVLFRILAAAYLVFLPASIFVGKKLDMGGNAPFNPVKEFFNFPTVWEWLGYIGNWMVFFVLGFLSVLMVTNEYTNKTLRQNIIAGLDREEFFKSKLVFMSVVALAATIYYAVCALVIGFIHVDDTLYFSTVVKNMDYVPRFWLMSMGYMSFGLLVGLLTKKTGIALFVYLGYSMVLESILRWVVHLYFFKNISMSFYPLNAMEDLAPLPVAEIANDLLKQQGFRMLLTPMEAAITTIIYTALFLFWSYKRLKNSDL